MNIVSFLMKSRNIVTSRMTILYLLSKSSLGAYIKIGIEFALLELATIMAADDDGDPSTDCGITEMGTASI